MKVVLQDVRTSQYVREGGGWTHKRQLARDFGAVPEAVDYALRRGLKDARVVVKAPTPAGDLALPALQSLPA